MQETKHIKALLRDWVEIFTMRSMHGMSLYARSAGLSMPQFSLLMRLFHAGGCEVHDIGRQFEVSAGAASQLVDRLVQGGLVVRTEDPRDRRVRQIALSDQGRAFIQKGIAERYRWVDDLVEVLGAQEKAGLVKWLPALMEAEKALPRHSHHGGTREAIKAHRVRP
jgi:DNA-binding MarR family transcriptional regulator